MKDKILLKILTIELFFTLPTRIIRDNITICFHNPAQTAKLFFIFNLFETKKQKKNKPGLSSQTYLLRMVKPQLDDFEQSHLLPVQDIKLIDLELSGVNHYLISASHFRALDKPLKKNVFRRIFSMK